jgi:hypothetical protein
LQEVEASNGMTEFEQQQQKGFVEWRGVGG